MSKYKVGEELIVVTDPNKETEKFKKLTHLTVDGDYAQIAWGLKIVDVKFEIPYVTSNSPIDFAKEYTFKKWFILLTSFA